MLKLTDKKKRKPGSGRPKGSKTRPDAPSKLKKAGIVPPASILDPVKVPAAPPVADSVPLPETASQTDDAIFGDIQLPSENSAIPETDSQLPPLNELPPPPPSQPGESEKKESEPGKVDNGTIDEQRTFATVCWDGLINFLAIFIGKFWLPRPVGKNFMAGEIPYDERELVIEAVAKYFVSIGMKVLTPAQEMFLAVGYYCLPRLKDTFTYLRFKFMKKAKPATPQPEKDNRMPPKQSETAPKPPDAPEKPQPVNEPGAETVAGNVGLDALAKIEE